MFSIFIKAQIKNLERKIVEWFKMVDGLESAISYSIEKHKKEIQRLLSLYEKSHFRDDQIYLKLEIAKMLFIYVYCYHGLLIQHGLQLTAFEHKDADDTVGKMVALEKKISRLKIILENTLLYLKENDQEDDFK